MSKEKLRCKVIQQGIFSTSYTTHHFSNWYEAITKVLSDFDLNDIKSIEIKMEEKDKVMKMV